MIRPGRHTATLDGEFVVFLIGMRFNRPLRIDKWWPVVRAMPRMIRELYSQPQLGFLHVESWFGRTVILVQYWRSETQLMAYAKSRDAAHLPAWQAFNRAVDAQGAVGIWHETYRVMPGQYENIYVDMPPFGLGRIGTVREARGRLASAAGRLTDTKPENLPS
jgi:hypothetical protein